MYAHLLVSLGNIRTKDLRYSIKHLVSVNDATLTHIVEDNDGEVSASRVTGRLIVFQALIRLFDGANALIAFQNNWRCRRAAFWYMISGHRCDKMQEKNSLGVVGRSLMVGKSMNMSHVLATISTVESPVVRKLTTHVIRMTQNDSPRNNNINIVERKVDDQVALCRRPRETLLKRSTFTGVDAHRFTSMDTVIIFSA